MQRGVRLSLECDPAEYHAPSSAWSKESRDEEAVLLLTGSGDPFVSAMLARDEALESVLRERDNLRDCISEIIVEENRDKERERAMWYRADGREKEMKLDLAG
jgi:hypothetical protein